MLRAPASRSDPAGLAGRLSRSWPASQAAKAPSACGCRLSGLWPEPTAVDYPGFARNRRSLLDRDCFLELLEQRFFTEHLEPIRTRRQATPRQQQEIACRAPSGDIALGVRLGDGDAIRIAG